MRFLIRCVFWLFLALLFIPLGLGGSSSGTESVGPLQALVAAREAVRDLTGICDRQPEVCATARAALETVTARAREGVRLAQELIAEESHPVPSVGVGGGDPGVEPTGSVAPPRL